MQNNEQLFIQVVYIFHSSAMVAMGKLKNPATDKIERDLDQAKQSIDILEMLKEKTKGNLSNEISSLLDKFLTELRLNFIDERNKDQVKS
ncbi:MAG TPA: DUF1844 domain-containing protein [Bacteroidia bacterium]|nr:DUF1844 domain-containing protein [Bacteroidia bacterium]